MTAAQYHVPGVYYEPQPRVVEAALVRTDVVGFIGFDPRVTNGTTPSTLTWLPLFPPPAPPSGHAFRVDVASFQIMVGSVRGTVPFSRDFILSENSAALPIASGQSIIYALVVRELGGVFSLAALAGAATATGGERAPGELAIKAAFGPLRWARIADVTVRRELDSIFLTSRPAPDLSITRCDDFRDYMLAFGAPADDGTLLGPAIRAFFANGGRRCWVATLRRPGFEDLKELANVVDDMVGLPGSSQIEATGLERLLLVPEVTVVDTPDLYALRIDRRTRSLPLPPSEREACFLPCREFPVRGIAKSNERAPAWQPIFESSPPFDGTASPSQVFLTQARLVARCVLERWRVLLLLSVPRLPDGGSGPYVPPTDRDARAWLLQFDYAVKQSKPGAPSLGDTEDLSCATLYWPWVLYQEQVDTPVLEMAPSAYAAGVIARRDLSRGPQISPANETLRQVVGLTAAVGDDVHGGLYDPEPDAAGLAVPAVNVLRAFPGYGVQVWGARTLSTETWLRFVSVRRTLTAIELRMKAALDLLVFEPNRAALWLQITHTAFAVLLPLFESGALRGSRPEEAFYVRCDGRNNPPEAVDRGELLVEVGVAVAAPAEFIAFRLGRREGVIEVLE
jgi:hypothetical protein